MSDKIIQKPQRQQVTAAAGMGALATLTVWLLGQFGVEMGAQEASAMTVLFMAGLTLFNNRRKDDA